MKIIIIGAGFTGTQLARRLIGEKNDVTLVEKDAELVRQAANRLDCMVLHAEGNSLAALEEGGIAKADALVALTESDEVNIITCSLVEAVYPKCLKIARVRNFDYYIEGRSLYGVNFMVNPDVEAAEAVCRAVEHGAATDVLVFDAADYMLTRIVVEKGSALDGQQVMNVRQITDKPCLITYIESQEKASLPTGATFIRPGDVLGLLTLPESLPSFLELAGNKTEVLRRIAVVGAGRIGITVVDSLSPEKKASLTPTRSLLAKVPLFFKKRLGLHRDLAIIDSDAERTKAASERYPDAKVFRADVTDTAFLEEEGIGNYDLAVCVTHNHEGNMVMAGYLKSLGVRKTIALVSSVEFVEIARKIGSDVAIPLKDAVVDTILSHLRGKSVTGIHTISGGDLEILEYLVPEKAPVAGKAVKDISLPGKFLLLMVQKQGTPRCTIPVGGTVIESGDRLILVSDTAETARVLSQFGGKGKE